MPHPVMAFSSRWAWAPSSRMPWSPGLEMEFPLILGETVGSPFPRMKIPSPRASRMWFPERDTSSENRDRPLGRMNSLSTILQEPRTLKK